MWHNTLKELIVYNTDVQKHNRKHRSSEDSNLDINKDEAQFIDLVDLKDYDNEFYDQIPKLFERHAFFTRKIKFERLNVVISILLNFARIALSDLSPQYTTWLAFFDIVQLSTRPFDAPRWTTIPIIFLSFGSSIIYALRSHSEIPEIILTFFSLAAFGHLLNLLTYTTLRKYSLLDAMTNRLEKTITIKNTLIRNISHEYRSPLLAINGAVEMITNNEDARYLNSEQSLNLDTIRDCSEMLLSMVEDVLQFANMEQEKPFVSKDKNRVFRLGWCIDHVMTIINSYAKRIDVSVKLLMEESLKTMSCHGSSVHLQQVLMNVLTNAAKASISGEVITLEVRDITTQQNRPLELMDNNDDELLEYHTAPQLPSIDISRQSLIDFRVTDCGMGIPVSKRKQLFRPFASLSSYTTDTNSPNSTGLGLVIMKKMVQNMGGVLQILSNTSSKRHGTLFRVILPINLVQLPLSTQQTSEHEVNTPSPTVTSIPRFHLQADVNSNKHSPPICRVIVADDNSISLRVLCSLLEMCKGEQVQIKVIGKARNGRELVNNIQEIIHREIESEYPHVIVCDYHMPGMNGREAATYIHEMLGGKIGFILLTADSTETTLGHVVDTVLHKPIDGKVLRKCVINLFKQK